MKYTSLLAAVATVMATTAMSTAYAETYALHQWA